MGSLDILLLLLCIEYRLAKIILAAENIIEVDQQMAWIVIDQKTNWTLGCISLKTKDITDLFKSIGKTTILVINP